MQMDDINSCERSRAYSFCFHIEISHSANNQLENVHQHTLEISICVQKNSEEFQEFSKMESSFGKYIDQYRHKILNQFEEFDGDTSIENVGEVLFQGINKIAEEQDVRLIQFEISENPLRTYAISYEL